MMGHPHNAVLKETTQANKFQLTGFNPRSIRILETFYNTRPQGELENEVVKLPCIKEQWIYKKKDSKLQSIKEIQKPRLTEKHNSVKISQNAGKLCALSLTTCNKRMFGILFLKQNYRQPKKVLEHAGY
jgi:hypothetical protein